MKHFYSVLFLIVLFGISLKAQDGLLIWTTTTTSVGPIYAIAIDPVNSDIMYTGSSTLGIYKTTDAGVGTAHHPCSCFDGTQFCIKQMLFVAGGVAPPSIVGNNGNDVGAFADILTHVFAINTFVANSRGEYIFIF